MDVIEQKKLTHRYDGTQVIIFDRRLGKQMIDWVEDTKGRRYPSPIGEFADWVSDNLAHHWLINWLDIDPELVRGGGIELDMRQRRIQMYAERSYRTDIELPTTIKRWAVNFADELDALHFKMRWIG